MSPVARRLSGAHSSARLERTPDKGEVDGSNPSGPTSVQPRAGVSYLAGAQNVAPAWTLLMKCERIHPSIAEKVSDCSVEVVRGFDVAKMTGVR